MKCLLFLLMCTLIVPTLAQHNEHAGHAAATPSGQSTQQRDPNLPPGEEQATAALSSSPRHGEFIEIPYESGKTPITSWIVYPERKDKAPVVIVIFEIYGVSDWIRSVADQLAREGFIAVAPDLISGFGPGGGGTSSVSTRDSVVQMIRNLNPEESYKRLRAVRSYATGLPAANGKSATVGYCWGGSRSFGFACVEPELNVAVVYYGTSPDSTELTKLGAPVLGLYGADDARVNATIEPAAAHVKRLGKTYEYEIYEGAGHGFLRAQSGRDGANLRATQQAWPRTISFLRTHLGD